MQHGSRTDPYRIFFPLGALLGAAGVSIWPLYYYGFTEGYSGRAHALVQTNGFLYSFIAGFLLTAIPRFTGTAAPSRMAQYCLASLIVVSAAAAELQHFAISQTAFLAAHIMMITLVARRFMRRQQDPPATFPLVGLGLMCGLLGALVNTAVTWNAIQPLWDVLGKRLMTEGMVLLLVLGVGGFLGPRLLGFAQLPQFANVGTAALPKENSLGYKVAGLAIVISVIAEYGFGLSWMAFVRAIAASGAILSTVQPWRLPVVRTTLAWCVWLAHWIVILSVWIVAIDPRDRIDLLHLLFIGGFTLLILAVGIRVTLSHGGHGLTQEGKSWPLRIGIATALIAMLARVGAPFSGLYFAHLAWAGVLWIGGMIFWASYVIRLIRHRESL